MNELHMCVFVCQPELALCVYVLVYVCVCVCVFVCVCMYACVCVGEEDFVNEYKKRLADRLLSEKSFETDKETRTLELLKMRFSGVCVCMCVYI